MLTLALAGMLAVAVADTTIRLPGTTLKFGLPPERVATLGTFGPASAGGGRKPAAAGVEEHEGPMRFFGLDAQARLTFEDRRLTRGRFEVESVSPHSFSYVEDQLRRLGNRRECRRIDASGRVCDWIGRATVHLQLSGRQLVAEIAPTASLAKPIAAVRPAPAPTDTAGRMGVALPTVVAPAAAPDTVWLSGPDSLPAPIALEICRPVRPEAARSEGIFGRVTVQVLVDVDGRVLETQIVRGIPALDQAALACARRFRFQPYRANGKPVRFRHELSLTFLLD
ncbi:MAG TPA: energy transducer TonB [Candidatus Limnocylindria bacterium]|nr:energy transducer TonB [Candidatus Limnocylindria bacterium]